MTTYKKNTLMLMTTYKKNTLILYTRRIHSFL